jgi:hypothetical protein
MEQQPPGPSQPHPHVSAMTAMPATTPEQYHAVMLAQVCLCMWLLPSCRCQTEADATTIFGLGGVAPRFSLPLAGNHG